MQKWFEVMSGPRLDLIQLVGILFCFFNPWVTIALGLLTLMTMRYKMAFAMVLLGSAMLAQ